MAISQPKSDALRPDGHFRLVAATIRNMPEDFGDFMHVLLNAAPHDKAVFENVTIATARYRESLVPSARAS
jgi:hypothetical protein